MKKRYDNVTEYYRIAGVFQATLSFVGDWEDGSFPPKGRRNPHKGEIQKRGHPYLIVVPLKLKPDVVSEKARKRMMKKARRRPGSAASDSESDAGFTSCDSDDGGGGRLGITNKKRRLPGGGSTSANQEDQVEKELVLTKEELLEPSNIFVLPMWLGEPRVTFETISVRCKSERGEEWIIKAIDHGASGSRKRHRARNGETFVCRQAMNQSQWTMPSSHKRKKKRRRSDLKEPKVNEEVETEEDGLLTKYLADEQFQLLTAKPNELLEDFIPPQWAYSFNAAKTQFIQSWEERPWYNDKSKDLDFFPYPDGSSDDSDGFDAESSAVLRGEMELPKQRMPAPEFGEGWTVSETRRKSDAKGRHNKTWHSPCGQEFRSIAQVKRFKAEQARQRRRSSTEKRRAEAITEPVAKPATEPAKPIKESAVPKSQHMDIDSKISNDSRESDDDRDSDELDKIVTIAHDVDSTRPVEDAAVVGGEPGDNSGAALSTRHITIGDLKRNTEALYAAAAPGQNGVLSRSNMMKQVAHLQKICDKPNIEEALPQLFLHTPVTTGNSRTPQLPRASSASHHVPTYVVERKDSTEQIAARVAYVMRHYKRRNSSSRPKALFYCLKATYAKTMTVKLRKAGVNASTYSRTSIAGFSSDSIDVLCLGGDGKFLFFCLINPLYN